MEEEEEEEEEDESIDYISTDRDSQGRYDEQILFVLHRRRTSVGTVPLFLCFLRSDSQR